MMNDYQQRELLLHIGSLVCLLKVWVIDAGDNAADSAALTR